MESVLLMSIAITTFWECSEKGGPVHPVVFRIAGEWVWIMSTGGTYPRMERPEAGLILKDVYLPNGSYQRVRNDTLLVRARYSLTTRNSLDFIRFTEVTTVWGPRDPYFNSVYPVDFTNDTLIIGNKCCDMFAYWFTRIHPE